jgi:hypothetical protein
MQALNDSQLLPTRFVIYIERGGGWGGREGGRDGARKEDKLVEKEKRLWESII